MVGEPLFYRYAGDPDPGHYYRHGKNVDFVLKYFDFVLKMFDFVLKMLDFAEGDRIGLCLDLDPPFSGDLAVYRNDEYLGLVRSYVLCLNSASFNLYLNHIGTEYLLTKRIVETHFWPGDRWRPA